MNAPIARRGALQVAAILPVLAACFTTGTTRSGPTHFVLVHGAWHGAQC